MPAPQHMFTDPHGLRPASDPRRASLRVRMGTVGLLVAMLGLTSACSISAEPKPASAASNSVTGVADSYDASTHNDTTFNRQFKHAFAAVDGVRMHYVTGGKGAPLVLLHGWPQSWYEWRGILPELAKTHTVYAIDLPGLGDSQGSPKSYDKATLARYLHTLLKEQLGLGRIDLVAHDLGAGVGFQYVAQFPDQVRRYAHLDFPLVGPALTAQMYRTFSWHLAFHEQAAIPEMLVDDEVKAYMTAFYAQVAYGGVAYGGKGAASPFSTAQTNEFARTYNRAPVLKGGFDLYRTLDEDERDNKAVGPVNIPTLLMAAEGSMASMRATTDPLLSKVKTAVEVPRSGHWLPEENPQFVAAEVLRFMAP